MMDHHMHDIAGHEGQYDMYVKRGVGDGLHGAILYDLRVVYFGFIRHRNRHP